MPFLIGIIVLVVILAVWAIGVYNSLVTLRERVDNAKAQIVTQIESRWDAVKSLIEATKQYSSHEAEVLESVTASRASIGRGSSVSEIEKDQGQLDSVLGRLIAVSEAYPDLKASTVYKDTMASINKYEDNVRNSRMIYNDTVTRYNRMLKVFPSSIIAGMFNFEARDYFEGSETKKDMPSWE
nr:LemA family protein [Tissierella sp.]